MAREHVPVEACLRCNAAIETDQKICNACGAPTHYMTFQERTQYEVAQYRAWQERTEAAAAP